METLIERHGNQANICGMDIILPENQLALSLCGTPMMEDGDDFVSVPYYVVNRKTGKKKKYLVDGLSFNSRGNPAFYVWKKVVEDIAYLPTLEFRYQKILCAYKNFLSTQFTPAVEELGRVGKAHYIIDEEHCWLYEYRDGGFTHNLVDIPSFLLNPEVGKKVHHITSVLGERWGNRMWHARSVLTRALQNVMTKKFYDRDHKKEVPAFVSFVINGRTYLMEESPGKHMYADLVRSYETVVI